MNIELFVESQLLSFVPVSLVFLAQSATDVFARKNNKTLAKTLTHDRYSHLKAEAEKRYPADLDERLGIFLHKLKLADDPFYLKFLNRYDDQTFCTFYIADYLNQKGLYLYNVDGKIKYIGRCRDSFKKRINLGYGRIAPKNCYLDGQATNCHLNALINQYRTRIGFYVCPLENVADIDVFERLLIQQLKPEWNITLFAQS